MVESLPEPIQIALGLALLPVSLSPKSFNHAAPTQRGLITPPCLCCGCAAAVVAIAAETIKTVAMRVFHWNMAPPSYIAHKSMPEMACGFRLRRGRGLHGAYMGLTWRATNSLTICSGATRSCGCGLPVTRGPFREHPKPDR